MLGKALQVERDVKVAPYVTYKAAGALRPGSSMEIVAYARHGSQIEPIIGANGVPINMLETAPGEFHGTYTIPPSTNLVGTRIGAIIDGTTVWSSQPLVQTASVQSISAQFTRTSTSAMIQANAPAGCSVALVDARGNAHYFTEINPGSYVLQVPTTGFPTGYSPIQLQVQPPGSAASTQIWNPQVPILSGNPTGTIYNPPAILSVRFGDDPLAYIDPSSVQFYVNSTFYAANQFVPRAVAASLDRNRKLPSGLNQCVFRCRDLLGRSLELRWNFYLQGR